MIQREEEKDIKKKKTIDYGLNPRKKKLLFF